MQPWLDISSEQLRRSERNHSLDFYIEVLLWEIAIDVPQARFWPTSYSFTFATDQEVAMFAAVGRLSTDKADPIWGLDQSFGVLHALDRLASRWSNPFRGFPSWSRGD